MTNLVLTKTQMRQGVWEGLLTGATDGALPKLDVTHQGTQVPDVSVTALEDKKGHAVKIPIPPEAVADGLQTLLIADAATDEQLGAITLMAGEALGDDLRVEVDLLRAELDMLKRAFRRHCLETG
ncbi:hypothetical protein OS189_05160 [Sulfitobacter sp. F26169L]|uniref:hypothetical protein n=1 Tax=Sulfitobacter sp. F26169L TaxID=2996015 RepID=UPI002260DA15|nr:hypothetical protein [Sulfitobacter sp. F26169L]MCX7565722.1 hypothetical protein [Sulfitobacter sp. F26169L]